MSRPLIGHLDPAFIGMMDEIKSLLQYAFRTENALTLPISAPGSAGMEAVFVNLLHPGDKVIVCQNGAFGGRMKENVERCGGIAIMVNDEWGEPSSIDKVEIALNQHPDAHMLAFVHAETSTGVVNDIQALSALGRKANCLVVVDAVTALAGIPLETDAWELDAVYSGTQKCLSCVPGLSPVSFSQRAVELIRNRRQRVQSWFLDMNLIMGYWGSGSKRSYHHTAPVSTLYALHESLLLLQQEGLEQSWARHRQHHQALCAGIEALGLKFQVAIEARLPQLNAVCVPAGIDEAKVRHELLQRYGLEIGAGLGELAGKVWRIGLMGYACKRSNVLLCLHALGDVLREMGADVHPDKALAACQASYAGKPVLEPA
ncbi:MAG: alanine--glyoxylate aminotransferase family protein [Pseudomonadales bacterium]|nr:alanine--glyoxylate aminotransferase family protein [Pseudomonadales bacterium]